MEDKKTTKQEVKEKVKKTTTKKEEKVVEIKEEKKEPEVKEIIVEKKAGFNYAEVIVIMIITLILGGVIGSFITFVLKDDKEVVEGSVVVKDAPDEINEFLNTYNHIINNYYEEVDSEKLLEAGINGMLQYLGDDYSMYMDEEQSQAFNEQVEGKYEGIGVEIVLTNEGVMITRVFADSPAAGAGLKPGDIFVKANGVDVTKSNPSEISDLIRNSDRKDAEVVVKRNDEELTFTMALEQVDIESVVSDVIEVNNKKIGYIGISIFAENTYTQFEKHLLELEGKKIDSLIIDVRNNSGGYLTTAANIISLFLPKDKVIYQLDTKGVVEKFYSLTKTSRSYNIAVLMNKNSASASEILAAALKESYGATLIGTNTFGKGTVQTAEQLKSGALIKYTIQKWLTPDGNWINEVGVTPDINVELSEDYYTNPSDDTDNQLQKAIEELSK